MKIFRIVLVLAISFSIYLGYSNFIEVDLSAVTEILAPTSMEEAESAVRDRIRPSEAPPEEEESTTDLVIKIVETVAPLLAPFLAARKRKDKKGEVKTLDDDIGDIAVHLGVSKAFVRGRLGLGDRRKKQNGTTHKRRASDRKTV